MIPFITLGMKPVACQDEFVGLDTNRQKVRQGIGPESGSESVLRMPSLSVKARSRQGIIRKKRRSSRAIPRLLNWKSRICSIKKILSTFLIANLTL
jgi:hypothetical protein